MNNKTTFFFECMALVALSTTIIIIDVMLLSPRPPPTPTIELRPYPDVRGNWDSRIEFRDGERSVVCWYWFAPDWTGIDEHERYCEGSGYARQDRYQVDIW